MGQGNYDHPSYLTRQMLLFKTTAGSGGATNFTFPYAIRIRTMNAGIVTAGTVVGTGVGAAGVAVNVRVGTAVVSGTVSLSTNAAGVFGTTADLNYTVPAGGTLSIVNGTDATFVAQGGIEYYLDPAATWTGSNN